MNPAPLATQADRPPRRVVTRTLAFALLVLSACKPPAPTPPGPVSLEKIQPDLNLTAADFLRADTVEMTGLNIRGCIRP